MDDEVGLTPRERAFIEEHPDAQMTTTPSELIGVGGWLGFLTASLIVIGPVFSVLSTFVQHNSARALNPKIIGSPLWSKAQMIDWALILIYCAIRIVAGLLLIKRWKPSTIPIVIACIWAAGPGVAVVGLFVLDALTPAGANAADVGSTLARPLVFSVIWTIYLLRSRRVKNTYRSQL